jgi:hypothetical protein
VGMSAVAKASMRITPSTTSASCEQSEGRTTSTTESHHAPREVWIVLQTVTGRDRLPGISADCHTRWEVLDYGVVTFAADVLGREKVPAAAHTMQP